IAESIFLNTPSINKSYLHTHTHIVYLSVSFFPLFRFPLTKPFAHLPPPSPTRDHASSLLTRPDLREVTHEWLSITVDAPPPRSLSATPAPPTPPPLPGHLAPSLDEPPPTSPEYPSGVLGPLARSRGGRRAGDQSHGDLRKVSEPLTSPSRFDVQLCVADPYDELLSVILDDQDQSPVCSSSTKAQFHKTQPEAKPRAFESAEYERVTAHVLNEAPVESQRPPSTRGKAFIELFIQEEDDEAREDEEFFTGRLSTQVEHL
ncbi:uncharacterized protein LOC144021252, partial [Festucalex cinctus]